LSSRCTQNPYVGGVPTLSSESTWILKDGQVTKLKTHKMLSDATLAIVAPKGSVPALSMFHDPDSLPQSFWAAQVSPSTMLGRAGASNAQAALETLQKYPELASRIKDRQLHSLGSTFRAEVSPRLQPVGAAQTQAVTKLASEVREHGGRVLVVGGAVRDAILRANSSTPTSLQFTDVDLEVFGLEPQVLTSILNRIGSFSETGTSFAVFKLNNLHLDVSLPRRETKTGAGHRGFSVEPDPHLSPQRAALRRDFKLNAISFDPMSGELVDPLNGVSDILRRQITHASDAFSEDPLRVLRAAQFAARLDFTVAQQTVLLSRNLLDAASELPAERKFEEYRKLVLAGVKPSRGLDFLRESSWVNTLPELASTIDVEQDHVHHPEGDVYTHTMLAMDEFARIRPKDEYEALVVGLAVLCHDIGKPETSKVTFKKGRNVITSYGHDTAGGPKTQSMLSSLTSEHTLVADVRRLVENHMAPGLLYSQRHQLKPAAILRLANKVQRIDRLVLVAHADKGGRSSEPLDVYEPSLWLEKYARELGVWDAPPAPLLQGRDLIQAGFTPGPKFGEILSQVRAWQLKGTISSSKEALQQVTEKFTP